RQRFAVLQARRALAAGEPDRAAVLAGPVVHDAAERGTRRYGTLAALTVARARATAGEPVDHAAVDAALAALDTCAGLEAWRVTAEVAAAAGVDRWWRDAERRAGALIAAA